LLIQVHVGDMISAVYFTSIDHQQTKYYFGVGIERLTATGHV